MKCKFCSSNNLILLYPSNKNGHEKAASHFACTNSEFGSHGDIVSCPDCGIIYLNEKTTQEKISTYYEVVEDPTYFIEQPAREVTFKNYLRKLERERPRKGKLLDVGTHTGLFVKIAKDSGWDATGVEPNKWSVDFAKKNYGISLINKSFSDNLFPPDTFDVITMWDVIEHFTDPILEIRKVYKYLKPGGMFVFSTVDPKSVLAKIMGTRWPWYMEMHRIFLDHQSAKHYLEKEGFEKVTFKPHWRNLSLGYFATRLAAIHPSIAELCGRAVKSLNLSHKIVPYYANDLYDCYAIKSK